MNKLTDLEALKYWLDAEFSILHAMFGVLMFNIVDAWYWKVFFVVYIIVQIVYAIVRIAYVAQHDKNYLKVPKK